MKTGQEREQETPPLRSGWLRNKEGALSTWRSFMVLLGVVWFSALLVSFSEPGTLAGAALTALLAGGLIYALVVVPVARDDAARNAGRPRGSAPSNMDSQTRLATRASITAALLNAMAYANRYGHPLSVALVDLDMLSAINSGLGRSAGDKALRLVAEVLVDALRMPDRAGRYGEEEFLVILPNTVVKNAVMIAERLRDGVEKTEAGSAGRKIPITVSIGVVQFRKGEDLEDFLSRVAKALVQAKHRGRNRVATDKAVA